MSTSPAVTGDTTTVKTQVTHKHKLSTWKKHTTLNNTRHTANNYAVWFYIPRHRNLRACLTLVIQEGQFYHYQSTQHAVPTTYAVLLLTTHAQPQASNAQHPSYSHHHGSEYHYHYQNRNWAHVHGKGGRRGTSELNAVPTFVTRWNLHPSGHRVSVWRYMRLLVLDFIYFS